MLKKIIFFFAFYRIGLYGISSVVNILLGIACLFYVTVILNKKFTIGLSDSAIAFCFIGLLAFSIPHDFNLVVSDKFGELGVIRGLAMLGLTIMPAYFISVYYAKRDIDLLNNLFYFSIVMQLAFFVLTYSIPGMKTIVYNIFGMGATNLKEWNMEVRGFGVGAEINFLAPVTTAIIALLTFRSIGAKIFVIFSQIINSNMTILSLLFFKARKIHFFLMAITLLVVYFKFSEAIDSIFPRLGKEIDSGFSQTINALVADHWFINNVGILEDFFGTGIYYFGGAGYNERSDMGWVLAYNYGGLVHVFLLSGFYAFIIFSLNLNVRIKIILFFAFLLFSFKGYLYGPNIFLFYLFSLYTCRKKLVN